MPLANSLNHGRVKYIPPQSASLSAYRRVCEAAVKRAVNDRLSRLAQWKRRVHPIARSRQAELFHQPKTAESLSSPQNCLSREQELETRAGHHTAHHAERDGYIGHASDDYSSSGAATASSTGSTTPDVMCFSSRIFARISATIAGFSSR